jgi:hypothetical protein
MMEDDEGRAAWEKAPGRLSDEGLAWYREQLNPAFERDHPAEFAALKASIDQACSATGQNLQQEPDGRSVAQAEHDRRYGIEIVSGVPQLPSNLIRALENNQPTNDPHLTSQALSAIGRSYKDDIVAATRLLEQCGLKVQAATLSAHTLTQLAVYAAHAARHAAGRPS